MIAASMPGIPAVELEPAAVELAKARGELARCRDDNAVYGRCYAALAHLSSLTAALESGWPGVAAASLRWLRAVDVAAVERLAELKAARLAAGQAPPAPATGDEADRATVRQLADDVRERES